MNNPMTFPVLALALCASFAYADDAAKAGSSTGPAGAQPAVVAAASPAAAAQALPLACGAPPTAEALAKVVHKSPELTRPQIDALLADPEHVVFIDVRRPDEVTTCGGFPVYLSIQIKDLDKSLAFIPRDRKVVTVSNHAMRAFRSADLLAEKGFNVVGAVSAEDYAAAGGALTRIAPPPPRVAASPARPDATVTR